MACKISRISSLRVAVGLVCALTATAFATPACAAFIETFTQNGTEVDATGTGTIDLSGMTFVGTNTTLALFPSLPSAALGGGIPATAQFNEYQVQAIGALPAAFGTGPFRLETSGTGDDVGFYTSGSVIHLFVPLSYSSGAALSNTAIFANTTFASMGIRAGTYAYSFSTQALSLGGFGISGGSSDTYTLVVSGASPVPEPASLALLAVPLLGLGLLARRRRG